MFIVMASRNDVIISAPEMVEVNKNAGFEVVGTRKTLVGAERLAELACK